MVKLPSAKVYSSSVSVSYPGQSPKCVKVTTLGSCTLQVLEKFAIKLAKNQKNLCKPIGCEAQEGAE